jgi:iron complex transport system ATP-binding protein
MSAAEKIVNAPTLLSCHGLSVAVAGRTLVRELNCEVSAGSMTCVLGCNGAGKTLTLHTLAGLRKPATGSVALDARALALWDRRAFAQRVGLLMQTSDDPFPSSVLETVLIGRHPHIGFWQWESDADRVIARAALAAVGLADFESRDVATLSGGERRRVAIAGVLTQDPDVMLLDEPTNHLDPHHQLETLQLLRAGADAGRAVVMSLHDAGLAARFCDRALLLFGTGEWLHGAADDVLNSETIGRLYGIEVRELEWDGGRTFVPLGAARPKDDGARKDGRTIGR